MDKRDLIEKLHTPFDDEQMVEVEVPTEHVDPDGGRSWSMKRENGFPTSMYAQRLNDVFGLLWKNELERIDYWGNEYIHFTIEARLPDGDLIKRTGLSHQPFETACKMFGIGGSFDQIAHCGRAMNNAFGLDWNIGFSVGEEETICTITVTDSDGTPISRIGIGSGEVNAFTNACEMFGVDPDPIPY